jgi:hypothetical protein
MVKNSIQKIMSIFLVLALVAGCFAVMPLSTNAAVAVVSDFDADSDYWISDTWVSHGGYVTVNTMFTDGTFWGDQKDIRNADGVIVTRPDNVIYDFEVRTSLDDDYVSYASFCAHYGSTSFGGLDTSYMVGTMDSELKTDILAAFNYIYDTYGSLDGWQEAVRFEDCSRPITLEGSTRVLSQIVVWMLIDNEIADMYATVGCGGWDYGNYASSGINEAVADVLTAVEDGYTGAGVVKDLVFLVGPNYPNDEITVQPQIVPLIADPDPPVPDRSLKKTVNGVAFEIWCEKTDYTEEEILAGITFTLHAAVSKDDISQTSVQCGFENGFIEFSIDALRSEFSRAPKDSDSDIARFIGSSLYAIQEKFEPGSLAEDLFNEPQVLLIEYQKLDDPTYVFDYTALYTIINGYPGRTLGYPGLNNNGDIFYIGVKNTKTSAVYDSFCAHAGSLTFAGEQGCSGYMVADNRMEAETDAKSYADFVYAYNYIKDYYGDLNVNRAITQVVTWVLLGAIDVDAVDAEGNNLLDKTTLTQEENAAVRSVIENYKGYQGAGNIVDVVYMTCELHGTSEFGQNHCQPQLVPVYNGYVFKNTLKDPDCSLTVTVNAQERYTVETYRPIWQKTYQPIWQKELQEYLIPTFEKKLSSGYSSVTATKTDDYTAPWTVPVYGNGNQKNVVVGYNYGFIVDNANHFTYAELNRAELEAGPVALTLVVGNKIDKVGEGTAKLVDGKLVLDFANVASSSYGAVAFSFTPNTKNGNIHSLGCFSHNNKNEIDILTTTAFQSSDKKGANYDKDWADVTKGQQDSKDYIYLYVHFDSVKFYLTNPDYDSQYFFAGWKLDHTDIVSDEFVRKDLVSDELVRTDLVSDEQVCNKLVSDEFVRNDLVCDKFVRNDLVCDKFVRDTLVNSETKTINYLVQVTLVLEDADVETVDTQTIDNGESYKWDPLAPGEYTVILYINGEEVDSKTVTVEPNGNTDVPFDVIYVSGRTEKEWLDKIYCKPCYLPKKYLEDICKEKKYLEDITLDKVYCKPIVLTKTYLRPICLEKTYLPDITRDPIYLGNDDPEDPLSIQYGVYTPARP